MRVALALFALAFVACVASPEPSPVGVWDLQDTWGSGSCGLAGAQSARIDVTDAPAGSASAFAIATSGTIDASSLDCEPGDCRMHLVAAADLGGIAGVASYDLRLADDGSISGGGSGSARDGAGPCSQAFSTSGELR